MTKTHEAVIKAFECKTCKAPIGQLCQNDRGKPMEQMVHPLRMLCPICKQFYVERSGNGFRHSHVGWCRLSKEQKTPGVVNEAKKETPTP